MIEWPTQVVDDVSRRRCVLFLGSGISMNSRNHLDRRPKSWYEFLASLLPHVTPSAHIRKLLKEQDYLTACEVLKRTLGRDEFTRVIREEFLTPQYRPAKIHEAIFALDSRIVATPNFDKIYETYANSEAAGSIVVKHHYDNDINSIIRTPGREILKVHGSVDSPENLIFTRADYAEARTRYSAFYEILQALALTHTFIFLGCGINDPDIKLLLEDTLFKHPSSRSHLMLLPTKALHKSVAEVVEDTMNLKIIRYSPLDNHRALLEGLTQLGVLVDNGRAQLRETMNW